MAKKCYGERHPDEIESRRIIDCADRMILAWRLAPRIRSETICELVREALWSRFASALHSAHGLELLTDNGPEFVCLHFQSFLQQLGLRACRTPVRSPQSNGLVEAFFGTLKRDYLAHHHLETLAEAVQAVPRWITHYNEVAPHSALAMLSPSLFYQQSLTPTNAKTTNSTVQN
jgi:putative transposase